MNLTSTNFQFFLEHDINPLIVFDHAGKILYINNAADILLGYANKQELYDLTLSYAPKDFGFKTTKINLQYDSFSFYAIGVGYESEEQIAIHLYHRPNLESKTAQQLDTYHTTDINILLEANISLFKLQNSNHLTLLTDHEIPPFRIDQNQFSKLVRKILNAFRSSDSIAISLTLVIGEYIIIGNKKERLIQLSIEANGRYVNEDEEIKTLARQCHITPILKERTIRLQIPFLL